MLKTNLKYFFSPYVPVRKRSDRILGKEKKLPEKKRLLAVKDRRYLCTNDSCGKSFKTERDCSYHIKNFCMQTLRYKCAYCSYRSNHSSHVKRHLNSKHKDSEIRYVDLHTHRIDQARPFACPTSGCEKRYKVKGELTRHLTYECGKSPGYKCYYCNYKKNYERRIKQHCKEKHPGKSFHCVVVEQIKEEDEDNDEYEEYNEDCEVDIDN